MDWRELLARLRRAVFPDPEAEAIIDAAEHVSGVSRRAFLRAGLIAATVAATVDVEALLWTPDEKTIFIPEVVDTGLVTIEWVTMEALRLLKKDLAIASMFNRPYADVEPRQVLGVEILTPATAHMNRDAYRECLEPAVAHLAQKSRHWNGFAALPLPTCVDRALVLRSPDGLSVRGVQQYDVLEGRVRTRLDIAGD